MAKKKAIKEVSIRSSAAEYLTYIASTGDNPQSFEMRYEDENIWLTQKLMATLYGVDKRTISYHIGKVYRDSELDKMATVRKYWTVQTEGERQIEREQDHCCLQMIIAVGFKVNNERAVQFRKWANHIVKEYTIKGWVMDDDTHKQRCEICEHPFGTVKKSIGFTQFLTRGNAKVTGKMALIFTCYNLKRLRNMVQIAPNNVAIMPQKFLFCLMCNFFAHFYRSIKILAAIHLNQIAKK
ncbi:MAG: virulence RhuM family protein [Firmicutes bacterium]|nr:virulence RhuM family protein [Bacillota bacterium]